MITNCVKLYGKFIGNRTCFLCEGAITYVGAEGMCKTDSRFTFLGDLIDTSTGKKTQDVVRFKNRCYSLESQSINDKGCVLQFLSFKLTDTTKQFDESEYPYYIDILECKGGEAKSVFCYKTVEEALDEWNNLSDDQRRMSLHNIPSKYIP